MTSSRFVDESLLLVKSANSRNTSIRKTQNPDIFVNHDWSDEEDEFCNLEDGDYFSNDDEEEDDDLNETVLFRPGIYSDRAEADEIVKLLCHNFICVKSTPTVRFVKTTVRSGSCDYVNHVITLPDSLPKEEFYEELSQCLAHMIVFDLYKIAGGHERHFKEILARIYSTISRLKGPDNRTLKVPY